jgi:hypothetical protein
LALQWQVSQDLQLWRVTPLVTPQVKPVSQKWLEV